MGADSKSLNKKSDPRPLPASDGDLVRALRDGLIGKNGTVIGLNFGAYNNYFKPEFIESCIQTLERKIMLGVLDAPLNALESLAIRLLADSAGIDLDQFAARKKPAAPSPR